MELKPIETKQTNYSRVKIEALDFDWIFQEENGKTFLEILTGLESSSIYSRKSIQILIQMLWSVYQPLILRKVIYPYILYVICFITLQPYIDFSFGPDAGSDSASSYISVFFIQMISLCLLYGYFISFEVAQFYDDMTGYIHEYTNMFDIF